MAKKEKVDADVFYNVCDKCKKLDNNLTMIMNKLNEFDICWGYCDDCFNQITNNTENVPQGR